MGGREMLMYYFTTRRNHLEAQAHEGGYMQGQHHLRHK